MNELPLVSVICLCHNQNRFVEKAIRSVCAQTYPNIELIIVDDGSTDGSKTTIHQVISDKKIAFIDIAESIGNCKAFNRGFAISKGSYIIDLAADDELLPERVLKGINTFMNTDAGVTFCDVLNIDAEDHELSTHFKRTSNGRILEQVPQGEIYENLIKRYFISPPSMMIKREVLETLGGYDENLLYEDFDFWIRSSREWKYAFTDDILVKKRKVPNSLGQRQFQRKSNYQESTLQVCQKIKELNRTKAEDSALRKRCLYEIGQCIKQRNWNLIYPFLKLI